MTLDRGATGSGVGVYRFQAGRVHNLAIPHPRYQPGLFWEAAGGRYVQVSQCWRRPASGLVISSFKQVANDEGTRVDVTRELFRVHDSRFERLWKREYRSTRRSFPEFETRGGSLFGSCSVRG